MQDRFQVCSRALPQVVGLTLLGCIIVIGLKMFGLCEGTIFFLVAGGCVVSCSLLVGNEAFTAFTRERECRTLESLLATRLTLYEVIWVKLEADLRLLTFLLACWSGPIFLSTRLASRVGVPWWGAGLVLAVAAVSGVVVMAGGILGSVVFDTTSQAIAGGWFLKCLWILGAPVVTWSLWPDIVVVVGDGWLSRGMRVLLQTPLDIVAGLVLPDWKFASESWGGWVYLLLGMLASWWFLRLTVKHLKTGVAGGRVGGGRGESSEAVGLAGYCNSTMLKVFARLTPSLFANPVFLREAVCQLRTGGGRWPGYIVFVILFLAPIWVLNSISGDRPQVSSVRGGEVRAGIEPDVTVTRSYDVMSDNKAFRRRGVVYVRYRNCLDKVRNNSSFASHVDERLKTGHHGLCLRLWWLGGVNQACGTQNGKSQYRLSNLEFDTRHSVYGAVLATSGNVRDLAVVKGRRDLAVERSRSRIGSDDNLIRESSGRVAALGYGLDYTGWMNAFWGSVLLLFLYLGLRCPLSSASFIIGEKYRKRWEALVLTGLSPGAYVFGFLGGNLSVLLLQMTVVFPMWGLFVIAGLVSPLQLLLIYLLAVSTAVAAAMLGMLMSAFSATIHEVQLKIVAMFGLVCALALGGERLVASDAYLVPILLAIWSVLVSHRLRLRGRYEFKRVFLPLLGMGILLFYAPQVISPISLLGYGLTHTVGGVLLELDLLGGIGFLVLLVVLLSWLLEYKLAYVPSNGKSGGSVLLS